MRGLKGKNVVLTGAGGGIGQALAVRFAEEGCRLGLFDVNGHAVEAAAQRARGAGGTVTTYAVDITDHAAVKDAVDAFADEAGRIDVLVNNAGWDKFALFLETKPDFWDKVIAINLKGPINLHHAVLPHMVKQKGGRVINVASDAGRVGSSGESVYAACKGGIIAFTKTMAREMARHNIKLNAVAPGPTDTALFHGFIGEGEAGQKVHAALEKSIPLRRIAKPEDIVGMIVFLASDDADYVTGQVVSVSGGLTMHG
ncbi:MAG: glucose 1-dehydrogenase [Alphaproteobacteria bacterium]